MGGCGGEGEWRGLRVRREKGLIRTGVHVGLKFNAGLFEEIYFGMVRKVFLGGEMGVWEAYSLSARSPS